MTNTLPLTAASSLAAKARREARRVTSYDVAVAAGVSQSAVSRCFQPGASVSKATYQRVMQAARDLDYTPNAAARSLITRRSNLVAVILWEPAIINYPGIVTELTRQFARHGLRAVLFPLAGESDLEETLATLWQHQVDGAIVAARLTPGQVAEFTRRDLPVLLFNRVAPDHGVSAVACDHYVAARTLAARLASAGHKRFAFVTGPRDSSVADARRRGICDRLAELGLAAPRIVEGNFDYASGARAMREIHACSAQLPDVMVCANDMMAVGCIDTARHEFGLEIPRQLSVTGFDGISPSGWLCYNLTTMRLPIAEMAQAAADMFSVMLGGDPVAPEQRVFAAAIVDGGTARLGPAA
jgi:DNA-binding LacI/PurR family transcriptional regulator